MVRSVLVLGAGELGLAMLTALAGHAAKGDASIAVLLRPSTLSSSEQSKRRQVERLESLGLQLIAGDVVEDTEEQLSSLFSRFHTIINATGMYAPSGTQSRICRAILASACKRYFPWQFGIDYDVVGPNSSQDLFTEQLAVRGMLRAQSRIEWVIVSTGMFTSFLFEPTFELVNAARDRVTAIGSWENNIAVTSPADIGRLTAEIALAHPEIKGVVYTAGDTVSMQQLADIVDTVLDRKVERVLKPVTLLKEELAADPGNGMKKYKVVFSEGVGVSWSPEGTFNKQQGIATETAGAWARKHLKVED